MATSILHELPCSQVLPSSSSHVTASTSSVSNRVMPHRGGWTCVAGRTKELRKYRRVLSLCHILTSVTWSAQSSSTLGSVTKSRSWSSAQRSAPPAIPARRRLGRASSQRDDRLCQLSLTSTLARRGGSQESEHQTHRGHALRQALALEHAAREASVACSNGQT